ncbi:MAG TPA: ABC transporter substrate-binding protein [Candidatus Limnocylindria bacterium]|nr:ABC transporter substrate-binding protein [Candidatus Limnocylindria bacterium]
MVGATAGAASIAALNVPLIGMAANRRAKTVVFASAAAVTGNWDPTSHTVVGQIDFEGFVFGRLTRCPMRPEKPDEIQPDLATSWKLVDKYTLEYTLRKGVTFHNGAPFGAEDVKATFEYASQPSRPAGSWYPGPVDVQIVDSHTVRLSTKKYGYPAAAYWYVVSFLPIMSARDVAHPKTLQQRPNGTGPFRYVSTNGDQSILEAFEHYHGGRPKIDQVVYAYVPDPNTRVLGLLNGQYQIIERLEPEQYQTLSGNPSVRLTKTLSTENKYLHFRCNKPPFDNPQVRMAACHAIDRTQIDAILGVAGQASNSYLSPLKFGYVDIPGYPAFNADMCQSLLAQAGFPRGRGLPDLEYIVSVGFYPKTKEYAELVAGMLQQQGFPVKVTTLEPAAWEDQIYRRSDGQGAGHMCDVGWLTGSPEPDLVLRPNWYSKAALITGVHDPEIDAALAHERGAGTTQERQKIIQGLTLPTLAKKVPSLSLFSAVYFHAMAKNLRGEYFFPNGPIDLSKATLA